jgi:hypothetical protein
MAPGALGGVVRERLRVPHVRLGLAVGDLLDVPHGLALHELRRALVQLALQALLPGRHVLDFVRPSPGGGGGEARGGWLALHVVALAALVLHALRATAASAARGSVVQRRLHHRNGARWGECGGGAERHGGERFVDCRLFGF